MKVAILHWAFAYSGGGERVAISEASLLGCPCFSPVVSKKVVDSFNRKVKIVHLLRIPFSRVGIVLSLVLSAIFTPLFLSKFRDFDVILCHGQPATWIGYQVRRRYGIPYICYMHQPSRFIHPRALDKRFGWVYESVALVGINTLVRLFSPIVRFFDTLSVRSANLVLSNSQTTKALVDDIYGLNSSILYPGVVEVHNSGAERLGNVLLTSSRHQPQKRIDLLFPILSYVKARFPDVKLFVTSKRTRFTDVLESMVSNFGLDGSVFFTGNLDDTSLSNLFDSSTVYVFSSTHEDFGLGPIEAMAHGLPVVCWDNAGPSETVTSDVGIRVPLGDIRGFADAIIYLLENREVRLSMGKKALERARLYSFDFHIQKLLQYFELVTKNGKA